MGGVEGRLVNNSCKRMHGGGECVNGHRDDFPFLSSCEVSVCCVLQFVALSFLNIDSKVAFKITRSFTESRRKKKELN